jgi:hypothetical protein
MKRLLFLVALSVLVLVVVVPTAVAQDRGDSHDYHRQHRT